VRCVCATCDKGGLSRSKQLIGYFYSSPLLDVAHCLAKPWLALCITPASGQLSLFTSTHAGAAGRLDTARSRCVQRSQFIEDTVEPSFSCPRLSQLFIMCVWIIRNNSLVGGRTRAEVYTPATERATLYYAWRPSSRPLGHTGRSLDGVKVVWIHIPLQAVTT